MNHNDNSDVSQDALELAPTSNTNETSNQSVSDDSSPLGAVDNDLIDEDLELLNALRAEANDTATTKPTTNEATSKAAPPEQPKTKNTFAIDAQKAAKKAVFGDKPGLKAELQAAIGQLTAEETNEAQSSSKRKPAWYDEDDEQFWPEYKKRSVLYPTGADERYSEFVRKNYERFVPTASWAKPGAKKLNDEDDDDELLRVAGVVIETNSTKLDPEQLKFKFLRDVNGQTEGVINAVKFFQSAPAVLVAGESGLATVYRIGGKRSEQLHSMRFKDFPIKCVQNDHDNKAIFGSVRKIFFVYDFELGKEIQQVAPAPMTTMQNFRLSPCGKYIAAAGRFGELHLLARNGSEILHTFKEEEPITGITFTSDSQHIICNSRSPIVSIYSLRQRKLVHKFIDEGCINGSVLDLSVGNRLLATGSNEGVVNLYDMNTVYESKSPTPLKAFLNLKTAIADVKFSPSGEMLAMSSARVPDALKFAHVGNRSVFPNFPQGEAQLGNVRVLAFSPNGGYFAMGTRQKAAKMLRLRHYENY